MTFHYDFVLKTLNQEGGRGMTTLIEDSYWRALLSEEYAAADKEKRSADSDATNLLAGLTAEQVSACEERDEIERKIGSLQNAKKKAALRELEAWETDHKNWSPHLARHKKYKDARDAAAGHARVCANILAEAEVSIVCLRRSVLEEYGFVNAAAPAGAQLTDLGRLASEINEGHPFLMTELFLRIRRDPPSLPDLLTILAVFLGEGRDDEVSVRASQLEVNGVVRAELEHIERDSRTGRAREERAGIRDDPKFWDIHTEWVEPIAHWVGTDDILPVVAAQFELFEGNLQRALMKLMGLVDEMTAMATLDGAIALLSVLEGAQRLVLRDVVVAESLYLRL
jgi:superfamily II RNA helicase